MSEIYRMAVQFNHCRECYVIDHTVVVVIVAPHWRDLTVCLSYLSYTNKVYLEKTTDQVSTTHTCQYNVTAYQCYG